MATNIQQMPLSGSTDGKPILVAAVSSPGTTIHTAVASTTLGDGDAIWLHAFNNDTVSRTLTVEFGGVTATEQVVQTIPSKAGLTTIIPGWILRNSLIVKAFADVTNVVSIGGLVNRITA